MHLSVLIDDTLLNCAPFCDIDPLGNKRLLTLANDFEDGGWRYNAFQDFVWDNIALTALSHRERQSLVERSHSELRAAAANLRLTDSPNDLGEGSELAEVVLYAVMRHHFRALPVVPKIFYKQNRQDFAKGSDSVHIVVEDSGEFTLWLGEAKFYTSIEDARLDRVVGSVIASLASDKIRKEAAIITNVADLDLLDMDPATRDAIRAALDQDISIDELRPRLHVPILLLHQCDRTAASTEMSDDYRSGIVEHHKERAVAYFRKQAARSPDVHLYERITFHIILIPVPSKAEIVRRFVEGATYYRRG